MSGRPRFATSFHPETAATTRPPEPIAFVDHSWPHFAQIRQALVERTASYPSLPLRIALLDIFSSVHTTAYLQQLQLMAAGTMPDVAPRLSAECSGREHCQPGYQAGLGGMLAAMTGCALASLNEPTASAWAGTTPMPTGATATACSMCKRPLRATRRRTGLPAW